MMRKVSLFVAFLSLFLYAGSAVRAAEFEPNNMVGIHVASPTDTNIDEACKLINHSAGEQSKGWGYITLVIQQNDLNTEKWQNIFNKLRECHAIPIVRLATMPEGNSWRRPTAKDAIVWVQFLDSLNWPVQERYIVLFNEPNHGTEWGGSCDGGDYADTTLFLAKLLKNKNSDFFIMPAGLDQSAPQDAPRYCDEATFIGDMLTRQPSFFDYFDGLASHSYPNPGFSGSPFSSGRGTIRGYEWELNLLRRLGITKDLPIFITETGWSRDHLSAETVANYYTIAFSSVWAPDAKIRAVTPFDLHIGPPFEPFSFRVGEQDGFYPQYDAVLQLAKTAGDPPQRQKASIVATCPTRLVEGSTYSCQIWLKNAGQAIWDKRDGHHLGLTDGTLHAQFSDMYTVRPGSSTVSTLTFQAGPVGTHKLTIGFFKNDKQILDLFSLDTESFPRPSAQITVKTFPGIVANGENFEFQVFNKTQEIVFKKQDVRVVEGVARIDNLENISLGDCQRVVLLRPTYLPVQVPCVRFVTGDNAIEFPQMLRVDRNGDGKFSFADLF